MNENPRHIISRSLDQNCDKLHQEQARLIIKALDENGWAVVPKGQTDYGGFTEGING